MELEEFGEEGVKVNGGRSAEILLMIYRLKGLMFESMGAKVEREWLILDKKKRTFLVKGFQSLAPPSSPIVQIIFLENLTKC